MQMKSISDLQFGFLDASRYFERPDDPAAQFFHSSFHSSSHLERATDPEIFFLIGEKGTGKTAYAVYASHFLPHYNASTVSFETSDFARFIEVAHILDLGSSQYSLLWSFILSINFLLQCNRRLGPIQEPALSAIFETVSTLTLGGDANSIQQCLTLAEDINNFFLKFTDNASLGFSSNAITGAKPAFKLSRIIDAIADGLSALPVSLQFTLFIDKLDIRPDDVAYASYLSVASSICNAIWVLNSSYLSRSIAKLKMVLLVRPDIFDVVSIQNRGPKLQNHSHLVEWPAYYKTYPASELFKLTDRVLRSQQDHDLRLLEGDSWNYYFNFTVHNRASGADDDNPFVLFLRHSFYKPRDILKYLSLMANRVTETAALEQSRFPADIFNDWVIRDQYSAYLMQEIRDQLSFYYTNTEYQQFLDFNSGYLGEYLDRRTRKFNYEDFKRAHAAFIDHNSRNNISTPPSFATADTLLQFMFELNVVGYY